MNAPRTPIPLILCCADDGEVALVAALDELNRQGYAPEVLMGVENDAASLMSAVDRIQGPALFVLCASGELDRMQVRRLSGLFSARRGPEHRLLTVSMESDSGLEILPKIDSALEEIDEGPGPDAEGYHMRDVIGPTGPAAGQRHAAARKRDPSGQQEKIARELHQEMIQAERVLTRRKAEREMFEGGTRSAGESRASGVRGSRTRSVRGTGARGVRRNGARVHGPTGALGAPSLDIPADEFVDANTDPLHPAIHAADSQAGIPRAIEVDDALAGTRRLAEGLAVEQEIGPDPGTPDARREADERPLNADPALAAHRAARDREMAKEVLERTDRLRSSAIAAAAAESMRAPVPSRPMGKALLLMSGAGMAVLIGLAVTNMTDPPGESVGSEAGVAAAPSSARAAVARPDRLGAGATPAAPRGPSQGARADRDPVNGGAAVVTDAANPDAANPDTANPDTVAASDAEPSDDATPGADDGGGRAPPPPPAAVQRMPAAVIQALEQGRIKQSAKMLFLPASNETMTWAEADRRCRQRKIAGLGNWRLPSKGQLTQLRRHGHVNNGSYWTRQVVGGDEVYAFDGKSGMSSLWLKVEPNGRSLCARRTP